MVLVNPAIARRFLDEQANFFTSAGVQFVLLSVDRMRAYLSQPHVIATWDANGVCVLKVNVELNEVRVELLLPRGTDCSLLFPVLLAAFKEAYRRYPRDDMRVWAVFIAAVGPDGRPDGGESECKAWQPYFPGSWVREDGGGWSVGGTLLQAINGRPP